MTSPASEPIQIHIPPNLKHYAVSPTTYLSSNPEVTALAVGAFIFLHGKDVTSKSSTASNSPLHKADSLLLIVQRASTERGFPNKWEIPGGGVETTDPTIFHSVARETFEETGLRLTRIVRELPAVHFELRRGSLSKKCRKLNFEIEVVDSESDLNSERREVEDQSDGKSTPATAHPARSTPAVTLDPAEHQAYAWVCLDELASDKYAITTSEQKNLMLQAFQAHENARIVPAA